MMLCKICGDPNRPANRTIRFGPWIGHFCEEDYMLVKQLVMNLGNIRAVLRTAGIHIGVPNDVRFKRNAS